MTPQERALEIIRILRKDSDVNATQEICDLVKELEKIVKEAWA